MKKQLLVFTLLLFSIVSFAQLQNNHWYFGRHAHLNFNGSTPTLPVAVIQPASEILPPDSTFEVLEGNATLSDYNTGKLLLYSDGRSIFGSNHQIITNGSDLLGNYSSSQNIVFLPKPGSETNYYAFTIDGRSGNFAGLYYSEIVIDCATIGTPNFSATVIDKNHPLIDHQGFTIDYSYNNPNNVTFLSESTANTKESITTAKCTDNTNYWVIVQINHFLYAYKVTSNGVVDGASAPDRPTTFLNLNVGRIEEGGTEGKIKISQTDISTNTARIARSYNTIVVNGGLPTSVRGYKTGTFNRATGAISFSTGPTANNRTIPISNGLPYAFEFSPNANFLYYGDADNQAIRKLNMVTGATSTEIENLNIVSMSSAKFDLQLAPDNKIYVSYFSAPQYSYLGWINTPNAAGTSFTKIALPLVTDPSHLDMTTSYSGLPQLVQQHPKTPPVTIIANNDSIFMNGCTTTTSTVTVQANDTTNGTPIASPLSGLVINALSSATPTPTNGGITLNANGTITVLAGTPVGIYTLTYQICPLSSCLPCSNIGIIKVDVSGGDSILVAANDSFSYDECFPMKMNVKYANPTSPDTLNGSPVLATTAGITVQQVPGSLNPIPATGSISLASNGLISVGAGTPPGIYKFKYKLLLNDTCASQSNEAVVTITVIQSATPQTIVITDAYVGAAAGATSIDSILVNDTIGGIPCNSSNVVVMPYPGAQYPGITINPDGTITVAAGTPNGDYSIAYYLCQPCLSSNCSSPRKVYVTVGLRARVDSIYFDSNGNYLSGNLNVFTNDVYGASPVTPSSVSITYTSNPYFSIDTNAGSPTYGDITVATGLPTGWFHYQSNYTICELANPSSCATASVELWGEAAGKNSVNELKTESKTAVVSVYPNPSSGVFSIQMDNQHTAETNVKVAVYTTLGQVVIEKTINQNNPQIDLSGFENGTYFLKLQIGEEAINKIIIKK